MNLDDRNENKLAAERDQALGDTPIPTHAERAQSQAEYQAELTEALDTDRRRQLATALEMATDELADADLPGWLQIFNEAQTFGRWHKEQTSFQVALAKLLNIGPPTGDESRNRIVGTVAKLVSQHARVEDQGAKVLFSPTIRVGTQGYDDATRHRIVADLYRVSRELVFDAQRIDRPLGDQWHLLGQVFDAIAAGVDGNQPWHDLMESAVEAFVQPMPSDQDAPYEDDCVTEPADEPTLELSEVEAWANTHDYDLVRRPFGHDRFVSAINGDMVKLGETTEAVRVTGGWEITTDGTRKGWFGNRRVRATLRLGDQSAHLMGLRDR